MTKSESSKAVSLLLLLAGAKGAVGSTLTAAVTAINPWLFTLYLTPPG